MITAPFFEQYRQGDTIQYLNNLLTILTEERATELLLTTQRATLSADMDELNAAWQPASGSEMTPEIASLDAQRDTVFTGLKMTADAWGANHFDPAKRNAAYLIADNIAAHGDAIVRMRYQQQTATLASIVKDLTTTLAPQIALLGLGDWVATLQLLNNSFDQKYVQRAQSQANVQPGKVAELVTKAIGNFRALKAIFEARYAVATADGGENTDAYKALEQEWNSLTADYNDAVMRNTGGTSDAPTPDAPAS